jgi:hypothetical protein
MYTSYRDWPGKSFKEVLHSPRFRWYQDSEDEHILPIQRVEKKNEESLFDLQTVGFLALKNATKIADFVTSEPPF